jgi:hypothetical protein
VVEINEETGEDAAYVVDLTAPVEVLREIAGFAVSRALGAGNEPSSNETPAFEPAPESSGQPARRKRRTKEEMQAARAAGAPSPAPEPAAGAPSAAAGAYNPFG